MIPTDPDAGLPITTEYRKKRLRLRSYLMTPSEMRLLFRVADKMHDELLTRISTMESTLREFSLMDPNDPDFSLKLKPLKPTPAASWLIEDSDSDSDSDPDPDPEPPAASWTAEESSAPSPAPKPPDWLTEDPTPTCDPGGPNP
jgi:hypothetical protein